MERLVEKIGYKFNNEQLFKNGADPQFIRKRA